VTVLLPVDLSDGQSGKLVRQDPTLIDVTSQPAYHRRFEWKSGRTIKMCVISEQ